MEIKGKVHLFFEQSATFVTSLGNLDMKPSTTTFKIILEKQTIK